MELAGPDFSLCLSYCFQIRKNAHKRANEQGLALKAALVLARKDHDVKEQYLSTTVAIAARMMQSRMMHGAWPKSATLQNAPAWSPPPNKWVGEMG